MFKTTVIKLIISMLVLWGVLFPLAAQSTDIDAIKPYVSKIKASVEGSQVILTWENAENTDKPILIYKYKEQISAGNIANAEKIATLDSTKESYIYYPPDTQNYFFAVNYALITGEPNKVFVSFRNITTKAVNVEKIGTEEDMASEITGIKAKAAEDNIVVSFKSSKAERELILYRSTNPIITLDNLLEAGFYIALDKQTGMYKDFPIPGIDYYYAILDAGLAKIGKIKLVKNENTTTLPVSIKSTGKTGETAVRKSGRSLPLPLLSLTSGVDLSSELTNSPILFLPEEQKISAETAQSLAALLAALEITETKKTAVEILATDTAENKTGEAYTLQQILGSTLNVKKYAETEKALLDFLLIKHAADVEARAHFYLGQACFFLKKYREAFLEFLIASDKYYTETQSWIDNCYEFLAQS